MELRIQQPVDPASASAIAAMETALRRIRSLRREEENYIFVEGKNWDLFFSALLMASIEERRREGYLITTEGFPDASTLAVISTAQRSGVDDVIDRLSDFIRRQKEVANSLLYMFGELIDNVFEHATDIPHLT